MISKSSYVKFTNCKKLLWLHLNKPKEAIFDEVILSKADDGNEVGELAKHYFENTIDCSVKKVDGSISYKEQIKYTEDNLKNGANALAEASFMLDNLFCAVDILKKDEEGYSIYEVKSSKSIKDKQLIDVSFQKYVLEKCGLKINHIYIMHPNEEYIFNKKLDIKDYFIAECVDNNEVVLNNLKELENNIKEINKLLNSDEPRTCFSEKCEKCEFNNYCTKDLPDGKLGDFFGFASKAYEYYNKGIITIDDYKNANEKMSKKHRFQIQLEKYLNKSTDPYIDKKGIKEFIDKIKYPIYYLDFETTSYIIPKVDGFKPGEAFPYQYSLHIEYENGKVVHKEYLAEGADCVKEIAHQLVKDIPLDSNIIAYHASTEKGFIKYLASKNEDIKDHLLNLAANLYDLLEVFSKGYYYDPKQGKSNKIKQVMPALCPHMENAYHELPAIHNGGEALVVFDKMLSLKGTKEYNELREGMLAYCELDTKSMVEIMHKLKDVIEK